MFDLQQVNAYRGMEAPDELRQRILEEEAQRKHRRHSGRGVGALGALAACVALTLALGIGGFRGPDIYLMGHPLKAGAAVYLEDTPEAAAYRSVPELEVLAELRLEEPTQISIQGGEMTVLDETGAELEQETLEGKVTVLWEVDPTRLQEEYRLFLQGETESRVVILSYSDEEGCWMAQMKE